MVLLFSTYRTIMAETQEGMSPVEMKVARQIEAIQILNLHLYYEKASQIPALKMSLISISSTTLGITIFRGISFSKNSCSSMMAGWLWRRCSNSTGLLYFTLSLPYNTQANSSSGYQNWQLTYLVQRDGQQRHEVLRWPAPFISRLISTLLFPCGLQLLQLCDLWDVILYKSRVNND